MSEPPAPGDPPGAPAADPPANGAELAARRLHPAGAVLSALDDIRNALFSVVVLIVLAGAVVVIAAGLFVIWRERKLGLDRSEEKRAAGSPPV